MKKVQKVSLVDSGITDDNHTAPVWFVSAMKKVERDISKAVAPLATKEELSKLATKDELTGAVALLATKEDLSRFYTKEEMSSSFRAIIDMLDECATKDDMRKMGARLDKTIMTLSNHETRIITLEGNLPVGIGLR